MIDKINLNNKIKILNGINCNQFVNYDYFWVKISEMNKILFGSLFFLSFTSLAQFDQFYSKFDAHIGYSLPLGKNYPINGGIAIDAEPKLWYNDEFVFGAKVGFNFLTSPAEGVKLKPLTTMALIVEKYMWFEDGKEFNYYFGASAGVYSGGQTGKVNGMPTGLKSPKALGLAPRVGVQFGSNRIVAEYHMRKNDVKFVSLLLGYSF